MWEGMQRCRVAAWCKGWRGVHRGHFQVPIGMVLNGGGRQSICHSAIHMSQRSKEHFMFVKWTLTYLAVSNIQVRGEQDSDGEGGRGGYRGLG